MAPNTKRVFYVNALSHQVYLEILAKRPDIQVDKLVNDSPEDEAERVLSHAHAYQIGSSRQELAMKYQGYTPLLQRCPNLVVLSTNGAGFDTINLEDATKAGIAAVNQAGGNKEGVAEHVMAMMLSLSKRLMLADHSMRSGEQLPRREFMGDDVVGPGRREATRCRLGVVVVDVVVLEERGECRLELAFDLDHLARRPRRVDVPGPAHRLRCLGASLEHIRPNPHQQTLPEQPARGQSPQQVVRRTSRSRR